jgi:hypothetical protein
VQSSTVTVIVRGDRGCRLGLSVRQRIDGTPPDFRDIGAGAQPQKPEQARIIVSRVIEPLSVMDLATAMVEACE